MDRLFHSNILCRTVRHSQVRWFASVVRRKRIVVLGTGWAGFKFLRVVDRKKFDVTLVSPRNHFLFTPLLATTTVGTLEFRCIQEPSRTVPDIHYHQAYCEGVDVENQIVKCKEYFVDHHYHLPYDQLVIACGSQTNTFGVKGVSDYCFFLKSLSDARQIRNRILECFERAGTPNIDQKERERLLSFVIVGGGPSSVEFAAELHDFLTQDVSKWYPELQDDITITLLEASSHILGSFDETLSAYTEKLFRSRNINLLTETAVLEVQRHEMILTSGKKLLFGMAVWSTGNTAIPFVDSLDWQKEQRSGRLLVDEHLAVYGPPGSDKTLPNIFAIGDCAVQKENPLPPTAQVAQQQGKYLAKTLNRMNAEPFSHQKLSPFKYNHMGMLAYIGGHKSLADLGRFSLKGFGAWLFWNSAYVTSLVSVRNKIMVPMHWLKSWIFGRDISRF